MEPGRVPRASQDREVPLGGAHGPPGEGAVGVTVCPGLEDRGAAVMRTGLRHAYSAPE